jgi:hypothetical protein
MINSGYNEIPNDIEITNYIHDSLVGKGDRRCINKEPVCNLLGGFFNGCHFSNGRYHFIAREN